ncbi:MAG: hypothetical protein FWF44_10550 [Defluviitaleaceae bacterium]|nr:hypothetical protein [Defluviitaleaceae bacterium]
MKFNLISQIIGGVLAIILGIMIIVWLKSGYGLVCILGGIVLSTIAFRQLKTHEKSQTSQTEQKVFVQNIDTVAEISKPIMVTVKISDSLPKGKFSVYLNGKKAGDICFGEVLQFYTAKELNLVKIGKLNGQPFKWPESGYSFNATQVPEGIELVVTHINLLITLTRV